MKEDQASVRFSTKLSSGELSRFSEVGRRARESVSVPVGRNRRAHDDNRSDSRIGAFASDVWVQVADGGVHDEHLAVCRIDEVEDCRVGVSN